MSETTMSGNPNPPDGEELKTTSTPVQDDQAPEAIMTPREADLKQQLTAMQSQLSQVMGVLGEIKRKGGFKTKSDETDEADGDARMSTDWEGNLVSRWKMRKGSKVFISEGGQIVDQQVVDFTVLKAGVEEEKSASYTEFQQMISANKIPVQIIGYLRKDSNGFWRPKRNIKLDEDIDIRLGRYEGEDPVYDGDIIKSQIRFLN